MVSQQSKLSRMCAKYLPKDLNDKIKFAKLLFLDPFVGILVTNEDQVYTLESASVDDYFKCEKLAEHPHPKVIKIDSLCGKDICQFVSGDCHILALTGAGVVYAWGNNHSVQLGNNNSKAEYSTVPVMVSGNLKNHVVKQVACGVQFSAVLTREGKVFTFGNNRYGRTGRWPGGVFECTPSPKVVEGLLSGAVIKKISCNWAATLCLSQDGKLFVFGHDGGDPINTGSPFQFRCDPMLMNFPDEHVVQDVSCGLYHTLALTTNGLLFSWGNNRRGQLGAGDTTERKLPERIHFDREVEKILAERETSFALDDRGTVYVWGAVDDEDVLRPTVTKIDFPEPFNKTSSGVTPTASECVTSDLLKSFDKTATSDFVISVEGRDIHVHKTILKVRSCYFETMFEKDWLETRDGKLVVENYSYEAYYEFLRYIYCGELRDLDPEHSLRLMDLATMALDDRLVERCIKRVKDQIRIDNLLTVFSLSLNLQKKELVDYCVQWAVDKGVKKIVSSEAYHEVPAEHVRKFFDLCMLNGAFDA